MHESEIAADLSEIPKHLAIIMDGNGRWAKRQGKSVSFGHQAGVEAVRNVLTLANSYGIGIVTLFAFSSENWQRPKLEVSALMKLLSSYLKKEINKMHDDGICVRFIGERKRFSKGLLQQIETAEALTKNNTKTTLVLAVDYGGQWDIANASRRIAEQVKLGSLEPEQVTESLFDSYISLADLPKPDLCIRTANEQRISNFLLWQLAYAELYFSDCLWPDFGEREMLKALQSFNQRIRRYGGRDEESGETVAEVTREISKSC